MNSDPSVCRVGADYYLSTSSCGYFPGVPIYHSRDLVHWNLIGHAFHRPEQVELLGQSINAGLWATTLRAHAGRFYLITTWMHPAGGSNRILCVTAENPAGPWSDPITVPSTGFVYDPSLDFIEGRVFCSYTSGTGGNGLWLGEVDLATGAWTRAPERVSGGGGGFGAEGQHLYKVGEYYYLIDAEGGNINQAAVFSRSRDPYGPYELCPAECVITNRENRAHFFQCVGHGDLVQHGDDSWWLICHAVRNYGGFDHLWTVLGRETILLPIVWRDGWPCLVEDGPVRAIERPAPAMPIDGPAAGPSILDAYEETFNGPGPNPRWSYLREASPTLVQWSPQGRPGLWLRGGAAHLATMDQPLAFLGIRQNHAWGTIQARWSFTPSAPHEEAGLVFFMNEAYRMELCLTQRQGRTCLVLRRCAGDAIYEAAERPIPEGTVEVEIDTNPWAYEIHCLEASGERSFFAKAQNQSLSLQVAGGFIGVMIGGYATGNGEECRTPACFHSFAYRAAPDPIGVTKP